MEIREKETQLSIFPERRTPRPRSPQCIPTRADAAGIPSLPFSRPAAAQLAKQSSLAAQTTDAGTAEAVEGVEAEVEAEEVVEVVLLEDRLRSRERLFFAETRMGMWEWVPEMSLGRSACG